MQEELPNQTLQMKTIQFAKLVQLRFRHWSLLHPPSARRHLRRLGLRGVTTIEIQDSTPKPIIRCHQNVIIMNSHHIYAYIYNVHLYIYTHIDANMLTVSLYHDPNTGVFPWFELQIKLPNQSCFKDFKIPGFEARANFFGEFLGVEMGSDHNHR